VELGRVIENRGNSILFLCTNITHTSVASAIGPSITTFSTDFFLPKPGFLGIYLNFL
jgi:hypothetical protein